MHQIALRLRRTSVLILALCLSVLWAAPAAATEATATEAFDGEPTDPEGILSLADTYSDAIEDAGFDDTAPAGEAAYEAWFQALVELLRSLGLLQEETDS